MSHEHLPAWLTPLLDPTAYDHPVASVQLVQTHISFVLLAGDFVYKFKKPVNFGFLDFSTLDKRRHYCEQELLLNRRLCPEIYLGLVQTGAAGGLQPVHSGDASQPQTACSLSPGAAESSMNCPRNSTVEYGIKMLRMPEERMMARMVAAGTLAQEHIDAIVERLVPFYALAERSTAIDTFGKAEGVAVNILENFAQTEGFIGQGALDQGQFERIVSYSKKMLTMEELFAERIAGGHIRDCHGDLYSANICLADQVYIYDCIEFNERFRYCDVASDVAFLAMDLDFHELPELSGYFIDRFATASADEGLRRLLPFYKCYRAFVRGKINLFTAADPAVDEATRNNCIAMAARYFRLADGYAKA